VTIQAGLQIYSALGVAQNRSYASNIADGTHCSPASPGRLPSCSDPVGFPSCACSERSQIDERRSRNGNGRTAPRAYDENHWRLWSLRAIVAVMKHANAQPRLDRCALALLAAMACGNDSAPDRMPAFGALEPNPAGSGADADSAGSVPALGQAAPDEATAPPALSAGNSMPPGDSAAQPAASSPFPSNVQRPQIMIVGDSISAGPGCYKKYLLADLNSNGYTNFDFVGEYTDDCGGGVRHSARSCSTAGQYTQPTFTLEAGSCNPSGTFPGLAQLVAKYRPDLLLIQLGVNDVWGGQSTDAILASYSTLLQQARAQNPNVVLAVAQIQQIRPTTDGDAVFARAQQLISALPAWSRAQSQPPSPVFVADLWTNSNTAETLDGVHPDDAGAQRMGLNWFNALRTILTPD